jgi:hypothetical protein
MKAGASSGRIPAKVLVAVRANVTAGFMSILHFESADALANCEKSERYANLVKAGNVF